MNIDKRKKWYYYDDITLIIKIFKEVVRLSS